MPRYKIVEGPEYRVLRENTVHKRQIDAIRGQEFNSIEGIIKNLSEPLHIREEDKLNLDLLSRIPICYDYAPDYQVAIIEVL